MLANREFFQANRQLNPDIRELIDWEQGIVAIFRDASYPGA